MRRLPLLAVLFSLTAGCQQASPPGPVVCADAPETVAAIDAHLTRADVALAATDFARAFVALELATELSPRSPRVQLAHQRALVLRAAARPQVVTEDAAPALSYAVELLADASDLAAPRHLVSARLALLTGAGDRANAELTAALEADDSYAPALLLKAQLLRAGGDSLGAVAAYEAAVKAAPEDVTALNNAAVAYLELGRAKDALALIERALKQQDTAPAHINAADALVRLGRKAEAIEHLRRATTLAPQEALPLRQLGALLQDAGDLDGAAAALERARILVPGDAWTAFNLGVVRQTQERDEEAVSLFITAMESDPKAYAPAYHLAVSLLRMGDNQRAALALKQYLARSEGVAAEDSRRADAKKLLEGGSSPPPTPTPAPPGGGDFIP